MSIKVLSCQGVVGSPVVKLGFWSFEDLKIFHPSSISSALCSPVLCGTFLSYQRSLWHLHVFLWVQFSHGVKTDNHNMFVIPFEDISLLLKDFFCNYFWTTAFFFFYCGSHGLCFPLRRCLWPALLSHQTQDVCVKRGRIHAEPSWTWSIPTDVFCYFFCFALSLCCLFVKSYISQFVERGLPPVPSDNPASEALLSCYTQRSRPLVDLQELIYNVLLQH